MFRTSFFPILAALGLSIHAGAQQKVEPVKIRVVLHDPFHRPAEFYYADPDAAVLPVVFKPQDLSDPILMVPVNGSLVFHDKPVIDPENPAATVAATAKLPAGFKRGIAVFLATLEEATPGYRVVVIDDSEAAFPGGESRALSLVNVDIVIQAGEHKVPVEPGKLVRVPVVKKVDDFNMAQTNFHYRQDDAWQPFAERQLQFIEASRRLFILHSTPGALHPKVSTIVDTQLNRRP